MHAEIATQMQDEHIREALALVLYGLRPWVA